MYDLYIGNKNYSSWSLRPWVLMKKLGLPFTEHLIPFHDKEAWATYRQKSPSGLVPLVADAENMVWDSFAIAEYLAEHHKNVWPAAANARAFARSAAAEMHSGFANLRTVCGMNIGIRVKLNSEAAQRIKPDLKRLSALWTDGLQRFGGPFLAGAEFTAADAFFCPVAFRVQTYGLDLPPEPAAYVQNLLSLRTMQDWYKAGLDEPFRDWPHDDEVPEFGEITQDLRAPATNSR